MSGQFAAMSEFLWRGYNVAIPAVGVGEDIFVVEAAKGVLRRVQVKTAGTRGSRAGTKKVQFALSRAQLNLEPGGSDLFFMLLTRSDDVDPKVPWRFILLRSEELNELRRRPGPGARRGGRRLSDDEASDALTMRVELSAAVATAWGHSLARYLDRWSADWPLGGPVSARATGNSVSLPAPFVAGRPASGPPPAPSSGRGTRSPRSARGAARRAPR